MVSKAREAFDKNAKDIERLLELHENEGGSTAGRRYGLEVLNKSAIVLMTAFWEAYCEDIAAEALEHIVKYAPNSGVLSNELKKVIAKNLKSELNELAVWDLSDDGWRKYLTSRFSTMKNDRDKKLNTPKTPQINNLFQEAIGVEKVSNNWHWNGMSTESATKKLDEMVSLRGGIAHRGSYTSSVTKAQVQDYFKFISRITAKTGGAVNRHVKKMTHQALW